jgi:hypothetical protein
VTAKVPDWTSALVADLPRGRLTLTTSQEARVVALPGALLGALVAVGGPAVEAAADALGDALAGDVKAFLDGADDPGPEAFAHALSLALGLRGLGTGRFERWGDALLLVLRDPPAGGLGALVARSAARAVSTVTGVAAEGAVIAADGDALSVLLASAETAAAARAMVSAGLGRAAVLARLHGG